MELVWAVCGMLGGAFMGILFSLFAFFALSAGKEAKEDPKNFRFAGLVIVALFGFPAVYILGVAFENWFAALGFISAVAWSCTNAKDS